MKFSIAVSLANIYVLCMPLVFQNGSPPDAEFYSFNNSRLFPLLENRIFNMNRDQLTDVVF